MSQPLNVTGKTSAFDFESSSCQISINPSPPSRVLPLPIALPQSRIMNLLLLGRVFTDYDTSDFDTSDSDTTNKKKRITRRSLFTRLPPKVISNIAEHLPTHSVAILSLTCKTLYNHPALRKTWTSAFARLVGDANSAVTRPPGTTRAGIKARDAAFEIEKFLELLDKDLPGWTMCDICHKLHRLRKTPEFKSRDDCKRRSPCAKYPTAGMWLHYDDLNLHIPYQQVRMVMRRHRLGPAFGVSLESLSRSTGWHIHRYSSVVRADWMRKMDVEPIILDNQLIMHTSQRILIGRHHLQPLEAGGKDFSRIVASLSSSSFRICQCNKELKTTPVYVDGYIETGVWPGKRLRERYGCIMP